MTILTKTLIAVALITALACGTFKGEPGTKGEVGASGQNGLVGETGASGSQGLPGTSVQPIQLCPPSFVPTYPNIFVEYGLCINNEMWGVYSQNGGFMTKLPPGTYSSNGINASCTFVILPNCVIQ